MTKLIFGVEVFDQFGLGVSHLADMQLMPISWTGSALGGPKVAEIEVTGNKTTLKDMLLNWLRYRIIITSPSGGPCWWGYVHGVVLVLNGVELISTLDNLRNKIAITYSNSETAVEEAFTTEWASDVVSQEKYGIKEHFESIGSATTPVMALAYRDRMLAHGAYPKLRRSLAGKGEAKVTLRCRGWGDLLAWRYYQRTDGRLEHDPSDSLVQPIGWGITASNQMGFGDKGIHDAWGRLTHLAAGMKITISEAVNDGNNKTWTVEANSGEKVESYINNSIYFEGSDDILDAQSGMEIVKTGHWILVTGSPANSRWHRVGAASTDHIRTSSSVSGVITGEGTGPTIGIYQAQRIDVVETATYEAPGASANITVQHHGQQIAQRVTLSAAMKLDRITIEAGKVGNPGSNLLVRIYSDASGSIGTLLTTGNIIPDRLTDELEMVSASITPITLQAGVYWILVRRSGSNDAMSYYKVGMSGTSYETTQMWTGSSWVAHSPGWSLKFRLWAVEDIGTIAETLLAATAQVVNIDSGFISGVNGYPTMEAPAVALNEFTRLISIGTAAGKRILWEVSPDLNLRLFEMPDANPAEMLSVHTAGGKIHLSDSAGSSWSPGILPSGMWAELADLDSDLMAIGNLSPAFIEEARYDSRKDSWEISFEAERSLSDILKVQAG